MSQPNPISGEPAPAPVARPGWPELGAQASHLLPKDVWQQVRALHKARPWRSVLLYLEVYAGIALAFAAEAWFQHPLVTLLAIVVIAGRQHSLYILNHDASHYGLFRSHKANAIVGTVFSNLVMFHHPEAWSFVQWRRVHMLHHRHLFTPEDPNWLGRHLRGDTQRPYSPGRLLWTCVKAGLLSVLEFFKGRQDYVPPQGNHTVKWRDNHLRALLLPFRDDAEMERERRIKLLFFAVALGAVAYFGLWRPFLLLWLLPMYTVYPMILTLMDLTEHRWTREEGDLNVNARSTRLGLLPALLISGLPRTLHREHHVFPGVVARDLPRLSALLCQARVSPEPAPGLSALMRELADSQPSSPR
ncbi:fatty acid desaturase [Myxococcus sp. AM009]|uniref:fatty acid desaturase family protein n=1 Tax=unclassified Myxococcus TaxID=2648731 RepID=UPI0015956D29|nr:MULTISPECIES: fatty acid desaturase [unclassified Myxococcus]NVI96649.1 fatty acid desaturase [Myxococcus sp. AM009]NVJ12685.1 fatty acid desaturase [Myxococcus sp. AM010]